MEEFDFATYADRYVTKLIELKVEGKEVVQAKGPEEPKIINPYGRTQEERCRGAVGGAASTATKSGKKMAPSRGTRRATVKKAAA